MLEVNDRVMDIEEAAGFLKVSKQYLYQLKCRRKIPYKKIGSRLVFLESELIDWIKSGESANE